MNLTLEDAADAVMYVAAHDRDVWLQIGMALKSEFGEAAFALWDDWSRDAASYDPKAALVVWKSIKSVGGIGLGTLIKMAKDNGWALAKRGSDDDERRRIAQERRSAEMAIEREAAGRSRAEARAKAAIKAAAILAACKQEAHAYLDRKGFPAQLGRVWRPEPDKNILVVPMKIGTDLVGCQLINRDGVKKFLPGQAATRAEFVFRVGGGGPSFWCEGYATGLSVAACAAALKMPCSVHVTFSAHNLSGMATHGLIVADHDAGGVGEQAAIRSGLPYFLPSQAGDDFNDMHKRVGTLEASQALKLFVIQAKKKLA